MYKKRHTQNSYVSSNLKYSITCLPRKACILYGRSQESNLYDLAEAIYNDCFNSLCSPTPLRLEVTFYSRRNYRYIFIISDDTSFESVLKQITQQFQI